MKVKDFLKDPKKWTKGSLAKDKKDIPISPLSIEACSFCVLGAVKKCYPENFTDVWDIMVEHFQTKLRTYPATFNDDKETTHQMVLNELEE
jgi:hypothetical protein